MEDLSDMCRENLDRQLQPETMHIYIYIHRFDLMFLLILHRRV